MAEKENKSAYYDTRASQRKRAMILLAKAKEENNQEKISKLSELLNNELSFSFEELPWKANYVKSLNVPVICFPREIKNYKEFCDIVKPDAVSIDYNVDPKKILRDIKIPIQGGLDPKILLTDKETLKKEAFKYLEIFRDHPYIFNLGHGILPETNPEMVENLIKIVKNFK